MNRKSGGQDGSSVVTLGGQFDPELYLLWKGYKRIVKKEGIGEEEYDELAAALRKSGLAVEEDPELYRADEFGNYAFATEGETKYRIMIIARDAADARRALKLHFDEDHTSAASDSITRELGGMLGYPDCCVDFFLGMEDPDNNNRHPLETLLHTRGALNPLLNTISSYGFITHVCCSFNCAASLKLARAALSGLRRTCGDQASEAALNTCRGKTVYFNRRDRIVVHGRLRGRVFKYCADSISGGTASVAKLFSKGDSLKIDDGKIAVFTGREKLGGDLDAWFFNWGGSNVYSFRRSGSDSTKVLRYIKKLTAHIAGGEISGWRFIEFTQQPDHVILHFTNSGTGGELVYVIRRRDDNVGRYDCSLNFNLSYNIPGAPRGGDGNGAELVSAVTAMIKDGDREPIDTGYWEAMNESLPGGGAGS